MYICFDDSADYGSVTPSVYRTLINKACHLPPLDHSQNRTTSAQQCDHKTGVALQRTTNTHHDQYSTHESSQQWWLVLLQLHLQAHGNRVAERPQRGCCPTNTHTPTPKIKGYQNKNLFLLPLPLLEVEKSVLRRKESGTRS